MLQSPLAKKLTPLFQIKNATYAKKLWTKWFSLENIKKNIKG